MEAGRPASALRMAAGFFPLFSGPFSCRVTLFCRVGCTRKEGKLRARHRFTLFHTQLLEIEFPIGQPRLAARLRYTGSGGEPSPPTLTNSISISTMWERERAGPWELDVLANC